MWIYLFIGHGHGVNKQFFLFKCLFVEERGGKRGLERETVFFEIKKD